MREEYAEYRQQHEALLAKLKDPKAAKEVRQAVVDNAANLAQSMAPSVKAPTCTLGTFGVQSSGKSSLLNALCGFQGDKKLAVGKGKTTMTASIVANWNGIDVMDVYGSSDVDMYETFDAVAKIATLHIALVCTSTGHKAVQNIVQICTAAGIKTIIVITMCDNGGDPDERDMADKAQAFAKRYRCKGAVMVSAKTGYNIDALRAMILT